MSFLMIVFIIVKIAEGVNAQHGKQDERMTWNKKPRVERSCWFIYSYVNFGTISCKFQEARDLKKDRELKNGLNLLK